MKKDQRFFAVDYEAFYDDECSITTLGAYHYLRHPKSDVYLVSIVGNDGNKFVGHPKDFDWDSISGATWLSHNRSFDGAVYAYLQEKGIVSATAKPSDWFCTADLCAYLGIPRSLKEACHVLFGLEVSKDVRDKMKNKRWETMSEEFRADVCKYALADSEYCLRIWLEHGSKWPEHERRLSMLTSEMCWRGVPVDREGIDEDVRLLETKLWECRSLIPWASSEEASVLSKKEMAEECRKHGVTPPSSMAKDSEEFEAWLEKYGERFPWAKAMSDYRRINTLLLRMKAMQARAKDDGWMPYDLKYYGAGTGRDSGSGGINLQNFSREELYGVDIRKRIMAPEGKMLVVVDLSNIEPRCGAVLTGDTDKVARLKEGMDIYEITARRVFGYSDPRPLKQVDKDLRQLSKVAELGLAYGVGANKFKDIAANAGLEISMAKCEQVVQKFRGANPKLTATWRSLEQAMTKSEGRDFTMELPCGNRLSYRKVSTYGGLTALVAKLGKMMRNKFYGSLLYENLIQGTARGVFMHYVLQLTAAGYPPIMRVHDEVVCVVDEDNAEGSLKDILKIMSTPPEWMPTLPAAAEGSVMKRYSK